MLILGGVFIALVIWGLFAINSKAYEIAAVVVFALLAYLNTTNADYWMYSAYYIGATEYTRSFFSDPGWMVLCTIGRTIGLSYNAFLGLVVAGAMSLTVYAFRSVPGNSSFALGLFLIVPGLISLVQIRQFVAATLVLCAILEGRSWSRGATVKFVLLVLVAITIHRAAIIALVLLFLPLWKKSDKKQKRALLVFSGIAVGATYIFADFFAGLLLGSTKATYYLHQGYSSDLNALACSLLTGSCFYLIFRCRSILKGQQENEEYKTEDISTLLEAVQFLSFVSILILPFVFVTPDFMRLVRYFLPSFFVIFAMMPMLEKRDKFFSCKLTYVILALCLNYMLINLGAFESVTVSLLTFNGFPGIFL